MRSGASYRRGRGCRTLLAQALTVGPRKKGNPFDPGLGPSLTQPWLPLNPPLAPATALQAHYCIALGVKDSSGLLEGFGFQEQQPQPALRQQQLPRPPPPPRPLPAG